MAKRQNIPESEYLKGLNEVIGNIQDAVDGLISNSVQGFADALWYIAFKSQQRAPVETGDLRGSVEVTINGSEYAHGEKGGGITVSGSIPDTDITTHFSGEVSYNTLYAANQHEHIEYDHPHGGQAKYLESVMVEGKERILRLIADGAISETIK